MQKFARKLMGRTNLLMTMLLVALIIAVALMLLDKYQRESGGDTAPAGTGATTMTQDAGR